MSPRLRLRHVLSPLAALFVWIACGGSRGYGDACSDGSDCESQVCIKGACAGGECTCDAAVAGPCPNAKGCPSGFQCLGAGTGADYAITRCFRECDDKHACPKSHVCVDGVCRYGDEAPVIAWVNLPRAKPCQAGALCPFDVKVESGPTPDSYRWLVDDDTNGETTKDPHDDLRLTAGPHTVTVVATKGSAETRLVTDENACVTTSGCNIDTDIQCCAGTCALDGTCH